MYLWDENANSFAAIRALNQSHTRQKIANCLWISRISFHLGDAPLLQSKLWSFIFFSTNQYIIFIFLAELIVSSCYELSNNIGQKEELTKIKSPAMPMPISILKRNLGKINTPWIFKYCRKNVQPYLLWMNFHIIKENA